jgi:phosphatidate cytidylyltransferase
VRSESPFRALIPGGSELALRVCSALVLVPVALAVAYAGGVLFALFWSAAAIGTLWEWVSLLAGSRRRATVSVGAASLVAAVVLVSGRHVAAALAVLVIGAGAAAALAPSQRRAWVAAGIAYCGALALAPIILRGDAASGFLAIIYLFAIVWGTDTAAFFIGRAIGGAKLMPQVSPGKTWSGAFAGVAAAILLGAIVAAISGLARIWTIAVLAAALSVVAQVGDLFESFLKRKFGAKDSGRIIPGHGGLMDRLDGFVAAGLVAVLLGIARGGIEEPARGLLAW